MRSSSIELGARGVLIRADERGPSVDTTPQGTPAVAAG